jgi:hypothetical protein
MRLQMKNVLSLLMFFLLLIVGYDCGDADYEKAKIKFGMVKYEKQSEKCDSTGCAKIILEYPEIKSSFTNAVKDSFDIFILNTLLGNYSQQRGNKSLDEMADFFLKDYEDTRSEFPDYGIPWEVNNTISVNYNANSIVSFQSEFDHFTGGAHGNRGIYFMNFNSLDGKKLNLSDLLVANHETELNRVAEKIFRRDKALSPEANLEEAGFWFKEGKFSLNENFGIKNDGLFFYFNSYEIAPYSMGPTEIEIPYKEIINLVRQDGLLTKIISKLE